MAMASSRRVLAATIGSCRSRSMIMGRSSSGSTSMGDDYASIYRKNVEDETVSNDPTTQKAVAYDDHRLCRYWAPHPKTGVFGPPHASFDDNQNKTTTGPCKSASSSVSVLEQSVFFRDLENLDKPLQDD